MQRRAEADPIFTAFAEKNVSAERLKKIGWTCHSCVDAPLDARGFSSDSGNVVRRFRVSGLIVRQFTRRGPVWKSEDRVQIGVARSKRSE
jgi:hypothetical protein